MSSVVSSGGQIVINADNSKEFEKLFKAATKEALEEVGLVAEGYAKLECPVDTGRLRGSITHVVDEGEKYVAIGTNVEYAPYIELGTRKMKARPFLENAAQKHSSEYRAILKNHFENSSVTVSFEKTTDTQEDSQGEE